MENTIERIDIEILPKEARRMLLEFYMFLVERYTKKNNFDKKANDGESLLEDLLPKKVCNFVPLKREEIYGR